MEIINQNALATAVKGLLSGCRHIQAAEQNDEMDAVRTLMKRMRQKMPQIIKKTKANNRIHAPGFNVFKAVGIERREAILHTPFLAFLLNPETTHGQGFLFLSAFFDALKGLKGFVSPRFKVELGQWEVDAEVPAGKDNIIDIIVECPAQGYIVVLENKIDAEEGDDQLWRYSRWLEKCRPRHRTRQVIFLTPDGREPISQRHFQCVSASYINDICNFLESSLQGIKCPDVHFSVAHYLATIKQIGNTSYEDELS